MSLSLSATQQSINRLFSNETKYIIPPYQRAYSWEKDQCAELLDDIFRAFNENPNEGYFLGNIVLARDLNNNENLEVIDGQQRLITLTLLIKILHYFDSKNRDLFNAVWVKDRRTDNVSQRLVTNVFEEKDTEYLKEVVSMNIKNDIQRPNKDENNFKKNFFFFFEEIIKIIENIDVQNFSDYLLGNVFLLPIRADGESREKATENALKIFETINNRGVNLSDSDIFKAKLYSLALNDLKQDLFIINWKELVQECENIDYPINSIFRLYSHIVRGQKGIRGSEIGLREFFTRKEYSPFYTLKYNEVMNDLFNIILSIKMYQDVLKKPDVYNELTKWFQLIDVYTNAYPFSALIIYLYKNGNNIPDTKELITFCKNIVRYSYFKGATTRVKSFFYDVIVKISYNEKVEFYPESISVERFNYVGLLKKGYALLGFYLNDKQEAIYPYYFDTIVKSNNFFEFESVLEKDIEYFKYSFENYDINSTYKKHNNINPHTFLIRRKKLRKRLLDFFKHRDEV